MSDETFSRRRLLRRTATASLAGVAGVGAVQATDATPTDESIVPAEAEDALDEHAGGLLADLATEGLLSRGEAAELATGRAGLGDVAADREGATYVAWPDRSDEVVSVTHVDRGALMVVAAVETGEAHAVLGTDDGRFLYAGDGDFVATDASAADPGCNCTNILCTGGQRLLACDFCGGVCHDCCTDYTCNC